MVKKMKNEAYEKIVQDNLPKENKLLNAVIAFVVGGLIGMFGNFLVETYSYYFNITSANASIFMIMTLIFIACLCTALGFFDSFVKFGKMGVIIPITGFAHSMQSAALDAKSEGLVYGIGANIFKLAGTVIVYGVISAYIFGIIRFIIMG